MSVYQQIRWHSRMLMAKVYQNVSSTVLPWVHGCPALHHIHYLLHNVLLAHVVCSQIEEKDRVTCVGIIHCLLDCLQFARFSGDICQYNLLSEGPEMSFKWGLTQTMMLKQRFALTGSDPIIANSLDSWQEYHDLYVDVKQITQQHFMCNEQACCWSWRWDTI